MGDSEGGGHMAEKNEPQHGDRSNCGECGGLIHYIEYSQWAGDHVEVLDAWWAHNVHPGDGHDAHLAEVIVDA